MSIVMIERPLPSIAVVRFNRPEARNALNTEVRKLLAEIFADLAHDDAIRAVVLTGGEQAFAAGADLKEQADRDVVGAMNAYTNQAIWEFPKPVIAAVNGYALGGGCEIALQCDFIIASEGAEFAQPEVGLGLIPGGGGTQRLPRVIGRQNALYMLLTGRRISATQAQAFGLVTEVVTGDATVRAVEIASEIAKKAPLAARQIKEVVRLGLDSSIAAGLGIERRSYQTMFGTNDLKEGFSAFFEKRKPSFKGE